MKTSTDNDNRALLTRAGQALYGERWQTDLARDLGLSDARRIRQWLSGDRPIPAGIWNELSALMKSRSTEIALVADRIRDRTHGNG